MTGAEFFSDGFPYVSTGAVDTREVIDKKILDAGILPPESLEGKYLVDPDTLERVLSQSAQCSDDLNMLAIVAFHRLKYIFTAFTEEFNGTVSQTISPDVLRAASSLYGMSTDPGEAEVLIRRITDGGTISIESNTVVNFWIDHIGAQADSKLSSGELESWVRESLARARSVHGETLATGGSLAELWHEQAGGKVPKRLVNSVRETLADNIKLKTRQELAATS